VANNNYPQITSVTSEALQAQIRNLLPSQEGFGTDLMAQNVIVPIIDLTSAAEGSSVPQYLQTALAFGSQTSLVVNNTTTVVANTAGFWRLLGSALVSQLPSGTASILINMTDGFSSKTVNGITHYAGGSNYTTSVMIDMTFFLASGESCSMTAGNGSFFTGSVRQVADVNGTLVNPSGFNPQ